MLLVKKILWSLLVLGIIAALAISIYFIVNGNSNILADKGVFI